MFGARAAGQRQLFCVSEIATDAGVAAGGPRCDEMERDTCVQGEEAGCGLKREDACRQSDPEAPYSQRVRGVTIAELHARGSSEQARNMAKVYAQSLNRRQAA